MRRDNSDLSACRHEIEGKSALAHPASWCQTGTIPARRPTADLPGEPLIMPNPSSPRAPYKGVVREVGTMLRLSTPCCAGTEPALMLRLSCPCWRPTWGTV